MARHVCVATTNQSSRFPLTKSTCCFFFIATKSLFGSFSVTSFNFSFLYIHTDTHTHTVCPIIITELSSQSKAPLSLLWLWPPLSPPLFLPLALSFYQAGGESLRGRWGKEPPHPRCVLAWQLAAVMTVCDSSALDTPGILIEFFISALEEDCEGQGQDESVWAGVCVLNTVPEMCGVGVTAESVCVSTVHHGPAVLCAVNWVFAAWADSLSCFITICLQLLPLLLHTRFLLLLFLYENMLVRTER